MTNIVSNNKSKIFFLDRSQLEERLEPKFYTDKYTNNERRIHKAKFPIRHLSDVTTLISDGTHFTPVYVTEGIKFISVKDVRKSQIKFDRVKYITETEAKQLDKRCKPQLNDVLLTKIGATFGYAALVDTDEQFQIFVSLALLRPNKQILPKFLEIFLNTDLAYIQFERVIKGAGVPDLHLEDIRKIKIPLLPLNLQKLVSIKYDSAYKIKQQKEAEAKALLSSIDTYILEELRIALPEKIFGIKSRIFTANFSEVVGERLDPFHNQLSFKKTIKAIHNGKYKTETLGHLIKDLKNGVEIRNYVEQNGVRYLRVTDLDKTGLNHASPKFVLEQDVPQKIKLNTDCLLISRSGSLGLVNVVEPEIENSILSSHIFKVELKTDKILPHYLEAYLRCPLGQSEIFRNNNGGVIPEINQQALKSIFVPVPPLDIQNKIIAHINDIHKQIKKLHTDAIEILESAKREVEEMILG